MSQKELLPIEDADQLLAAIERGELDEAARWPVTMAEMVDLFAAEMVHAESLAEDQARRRAQRLVAVLARHWGGGALYVPKGDKLERALRDAAIWAEHDGTAHGPRGVSALARKHALSEMQVYNILKEQRALHRKRVQRELF